MTDEDFCALYEAYARRLWAYVRRVTGDAAAADDIVQETFVRILTAATMAIADPEHRRRYLYKVATNLIRRRQRSISYPPREETAGSVTMTKIDDALAVEEALAELSAVERQTLWLAYVEGWSWREVAAILGYREGSIRHVAVRARRRVRALLGIDRTSEKQ